MTTQYKAEQSREEQSKERRTEKREARGARAQPKTREETQQTQDKRDEVYKLEEGRKEKLTSAIDRNKQSIEIKNKLTTERKTNKRTGSVGFGHKTRKQGGRFQNVR